MPKKCESCRHFGTAYNGPKRVLVPGLADRSRHTRTEFCSNDLLCSDDIKEMFPDRKGLPLDYARNICDREGDGHFVYFEPNTPAAGAAVSEPPASAGGQFVQITRTHHPRALKAAA